MNALIDFIVALVYIISSFTNVVCAASVPGMSVMCARVGTCTHGCVCTDASVWTCEHMR